MIIHIVCISLKCPQKYFLNHDKITKIANIRFN